MAKTSPTNMRVGTYVARTATGESFKAYVPTKLPPQPPLDMDGLYKPIDRAMKALGGIDALAKLLPDTRLFLFMYVRKEALVSSQIEGTQSSLSDLLLFENNENTSVPFDDVEEVSNYIAALTYGLNRMKKGFPLSTRLIRDVHKMLMRGVRGHAKAPGEFRRSQNWIGGIRPGKARFVPPPPEMVNDLMSDFEKFMHDEDQKLPALIKAALIHVQFETIHPFLDGNGRLGRLLITLLLCSEGVLAYLKRRGVLLAIASRNDESRIVALWDKILGGTLHLSDFAVVKINWNPKVENMAEILKLTNILPDNVVFIDDNPVERAAIQAAFPALRTLGRYPYYLKRILLWAPETQTPTLTEESAKRTKMVQAQIGREEVRKQMPRDEFLASLNITVDFVDVTSVSHPRFARTLELLNKTNQFNTTGRRWTHTECDAKYKEGWRFAAFTVKDRFTDYGLVSCVLISGNTIEQFVMSCRVLGLEVESKIIASIAEFMHASGFKTINGVLIETERNFPCRDMYARCGFTQKGEIWTKSFTAFA